MVQYVAKYQYANMEHMNQMYSAAEVGSIIQFYTVRNCSATEIHKKLHTLYVGPMHCGLYNAHNFLCISVALQFRMV